MSRYKSEGHYVIDTTTDIAVAKACVLKGTNLLANAEREHEGKVFTSILAAALNVYNQQQGGI